MPEPLKTVLTHERAARDAAWQRLRSDLDLLAPDGVLAAWVLDDPAAHRWRTVDAALDRSTCPDCGEVLGSGVRGCRPCDFADGSRFVGQEPDRPGVPPGNEHALRVSLTVVRHPQRWPAFAVTANRLYLPLFAAGDMPTKNERYALAAMVGVGHVDELRDATSFSDMAARARTSFT